MDAVSIIVGAVLLILGLVVGWLGGRQSARRSAREREATWRAELDAARGEVSALQRDRDQLRLDQQATQSLDDRLEPVRTALESLRQQSMQSDKDRARTDAELRERLTAVQGNVATLEAATKQLVIAMSSGKTRGQWGEMQLERLLEHSGLVEGVHFRRQDTRSAEAGMSRPDIVVLMPGGAEILIDAKFPFDAYWEAIGRADGPESADLMRKHAADVLARAKELAGKRYADSARSPDFVIMFMPLESLLQEALSSDGLLLEKSFQSNVVIATPTSMLAMLRTIAFGYQRNDLARNAELIQQVGAELLARLGVLTEHVDHMRKGLERAVESYNGLIGSLDSRVLVSARQMHDLGIPIAKSLDAPAEITGHLRQSNAGGAPTMPA
ncbi:MAG: DNA recombination protein RmuC [Actinomycetales bacterium]|nr:DNA recombination protein RmuC [Actinomycetales bacterium]